MTWRPVLWWTFVVADGPPTVSDAVSEVADDRVAAIWGANAERCRALYRQHKNDRTATANLTAIADYCKNIIDAQTNEKYGEVL